MTNVKSDQQQVEKLLQDLTAIYFGGSLTIDKMARISHVVTC